VGGCPVASIQPEVRRYPRTLTEVPPLRGFSGRVGRTLAAIPLTIRDAFPGVGSLLGAIFGGGVLRNGGLRGGSVAVSISDATVALHGVMFIPGVRVSGRLVQAAMPGAIRGHLQISGPAAARGTLTVHGPTVTGRLGGRAVRATMHLSLSDLTFSARAAAVGLGRQWPESRPTLQLTSAARRSSS
jgi:hypothetical protein